MIGFRHDTCGIDYFIGYILHQLMQLIHTDNFHIISNTNIYLTAMRVSETGYPLKILVFPNLFVFYVLILIVHIANIT